MSVILNIAFVGTLIAGLAGLSSCAVTASCVVLSVKIQFSDYVKIRFTSQLINCISKILQKLLQYFNDTTIFCVIVVIIIWCFSYNTSFGEFFIESAS